MLDRELKKQIQRWIDWLRTQRNYSPHTIQSYVSDLEIFIEYLAKERVTLSDLKKIDIRGFRNFFSLRAKRGISRTSIAREESAVKNFFKWLDNNGIIRNSAIFQISTPKLPKVLPRSLDVNTMFDVIDEASSKVRLKVKMEKISFYLFIMRLNLFITELTKRLTT
ncbi:site-specific integrase [uncultured Streptococcus sp.]|uniref:site-specific integrase n=1 Tax=uncultured Streptococcus sp. TaxID=83427 RepID=UPI0025940229|nr:site-specific integrase [uncultured Streptococcus sp.]